MSNQLALERSESLPFLRAYGPELWMEETASGLKVIIISHKGLHIPTPSSLLLVPQSPNYTAFSLLEAPGSFT
jgi:hypothetical protein